jgi:hypothetical protein
MAVDHLLQILNSLPGVQRDGTQYDSNNYVGGQWCRFYEKGRPRKIGGYALIDPGSTKLIRSMYPINRQNAVDIYLGRSSTLDVLNITLTGIASPEFTRTPVGFESSLTTITLGNDPISTVNTSSIVTVTVPTTVNLHTGDVVTIAGATAIATITAPQLNITTPIIVLSATTFSYITAGTANATTTGGGAAVSYSVDDQNNLWTFDIYTVFDSTTTVNLAADPIATVNLSSVVVVTVSSTANLRTNNIVTIVGAIAVNNITAVELNISAVITVLSATTFSYVSNGAANATGSGGGAGVSYAIDIPVNYIIAHAAQNAEDINNNIETQIWWGDITLTTPLTAITDPNQSCSGGIVVAYPFLFKYTNDGIVVYTDNPADWTGANVVSIAGTKIIKGLRTRGGSNSPAILFWSLNSLVRATFIGGATEFQFDTIQDDISVMGQNTIVTYNNIYFWIGVDQFYIYNGVVQRLENDMSANYFFDNINMKYRNKVWGFVLPRFHEVWWFYPKGNSSECNNLIIYNYQLNTWYDSILGRTAGLAPGFFPYPLMADAETVFDKATGSGEKYGVWKHEFGVDKVLFGQNLAIDSYYDTNIISYFEQSGADDRQMRVRRIEPDFVQQQEMTLNVMSRDFAQGPVTTSTPYTFHPDTNLVLLAKIDTINMGRLVNFRFRSNISGGFYQTGKVLLNYALGDVYP